VKYYGVTFYSVGILLITVSQTIINDNLHVFYGETIHFQ